MPKLLQPHNPSWTRDFEKEAAALRDAWGSAIIQLHHIGSTSIPNIMAKPIVDILGEAGSLADIDSKTSVLESAGYEARGEYGIAGRRYFKKTASTPSDLGYHVHVYQQGSPHIARHLRFRDFLLQHPEIARAYSDLKVSLLDPSGALPTDYANRKSHFIDHIEAQTSDHPLRSAGRT